MSSSSESIRYWRSGRNIVDQQKLKKYACDAFYVCNNKYTVCCTLVKYRSVGKV